jgi:hypothetical protein
MSHVVDLFKDNYKNFIQMDLSQLDSLYSDDMVFKDPIHEIRGLVSMQDYMSAICENLLECRFEFLDQIESDNAAYIKWNMHYRHPKLASGKLLTLRGVSLIHFDERINYHEDIYDMGAMLYEHLPFIGGVTRWLKNRLTQ